MVLHAKLITEVFKQGIKLAGRYYAVESRAFSKLYSGFPKSRTIGRGVRHGLVAGQIAGSFINQEGFDSGGNAPVPFKKQRFRLKARKSHKARGRRPARCRVRRNRF